ncbi:DEAD/DEAH box helicase, partial [Eubacteriales bacterium OttesenSCG-928-N13]|nr:DEAD/DEAH box helicase [Eubacteriales bacterium OttesenSCG-928-N13]
MKRQNINVRSLAEFSMESGDLRAAMMMLDRMQDGMHGHKMLQGGYPAGYKSEVSVSLDVEVDGVPLRVVGRIDGLNLGGEPPLIDEIKTTQRDPSMIGEMDFPVHWAQAEIYAHIVCVQHQLPRAIVRLSYYNLNGSCQMFEHEHTAKELREIFLGYARPYAEWLKALAEWQGISLPTQSALAFPFAQYREGQRDMAANAYVAIREKKNLLVQAPTGIGKTAGALFPAIKALGEGQTSRIFYLTARTTTRAVAEQTIERMRQEGLRIRSLTLTAKEKMCLYPGERCSPDLCERARGYFDKRRAAIMEALGIERLTRDAIEQLAERHEVCPFELSLDLSEISDVVIGDYNHAFDPRVKLKRFFLDKGDYCLLIDEAHNLIDRSREMLSSSIDQRMFSALRRDLGRLLGKRHPLYACLTELIDAFNALREQYDQPTMEQEPPISLTEPLKQFAADVAPMVEGGSPALVDAYFAALGYLRACEMFDGSYRTLIEPSEK